MILKRLFFNARLGPGSEVELVEEQARYLGRVLRLRLGDMLTVFNGEHGEWTATIVKAGKDRMTLKVGEHRESSTESALRIHLVQGISRGERMDFVVQKATELGVKRITPVLSAHGVIKLDGDRAMKRQSHWQRVAESACEQSGRIKPPLIDTPLPLNTWFGGKDTGNSDDSSEYILHPGAQAPLTAIDQPATKLCLLIGPEGGFSDREYADAEVAGFRAVSIGPRILRTETAAVAAMAIVQSMWGDLGP